MPKEADKLIKVKEVAEMIGLSPQTIYLGQAGTDELLRVRLGRSVRFSYLDVVAWIEKKKAEAIEASTEANRKMRSVRLHLIKKPVLTKKQIERICRRTKKTG